MGILLVRTIPSFLRTVINGLDAPCTVEQFKCGTAATLDQKDGLITVLQDSETSTLSAEVCQSS